MPMTEALSWRDTIHPSWQPVLEPVADIIDQRLEHLSNRDTEQPAIVPAAHNIFRAFTQPFDQVRVLLVGQDPYPNPEHAMGWSFSVPVTTQPLPKSLHNIFTELSTDVDCPPPVHGDLSHWVSQGVMLLNRELTTLAGNPGAHHGYWLDVTDTVVRALAERNQPLVAILWGKQAQSLTPLLGQTPIVASAHPSPLAAYRGFFGSRPFTRTNQLLAEQGGQPIDWVLPSVTTSTLF